MATGVPPYSAYVVSDRETWSEDALSVCGRAGFFPELVPWSGARELSKRSDAFLVDLPDARNSATERLLEWAARGWQPIVVASLEPVLGGHELLRRLESESYRRLVPRFAVDDYWTALQNHLEDIRTTWAWLISDLLAADEPHSTALVKVLTLAVARSPGRLRVSDWLSRARQERAPNLRATLSEHEWPNPKGVLSILDILRATDILKREPGATLGQAAERIGYPSGDYLGKRSSAIGGLALGRLIEMSLIEVAERLLEQARKRWNRD